MLFRGSINRCCLLTSRMTFNKIPGEGDARVGVSREVAGRGDSWMGQMRREVAAGVRERLEVAAATETGQMRGAISELAAATGVNILRPWDKARIVQALTEHDADRDLRWKVQRIVSNAGKLERMLVEFRQTVEGDDE